MIYSRHSRTLGFLSHLLYFFSIFVFIIAFGFQHNPPSGWYKQFLPDLQGASLTDITFTDSLTGYAVTKINTDVREFSKVQFLNNDTGYAGTLFSSLTSRSILFKTTNGGVSWESIGRPNEDFLFEDFWVVNTDSIWATYYGVFGGGIYRTVNGGQTWENQYYAFGNNPHRIYMFNGRMGFMYNEKDSLFKTTNSGLNWFRIPGGAFTDIYFLDTLTGWKANGPVKITSNGGLSWNEVFPLGGISHLNFNSANILCGSGGGIFYPGIGQRGIVSKSTNGGFTWGYQIPDTSFHNQVYRYIQFATDSIDWAYSFTKGIHTVTGGNDTTYYPTSITQNTTAVSNTFTLQQNFPNPFNPTTKIIYRITRSSYIILDVYNIQGKKVKSIVSERQSAGEYEVQFSATEYGSSISSGVYFYSLTADGKTIDTKMMVVLK